MQDTRWDKSLVSIIIPCYNAERWIKEAIDSCLEQIYRPIEIIVVDDGSTDTSVTILQKFGSQIILETGSNLGGNHARNRGFALSCGEFIQFLDADDYLLPKKIAHQVSYLQEIGANVVYGDWRHQFHEPDGGDHLGEMIVSGEQTDVLEALLAGWWVAPAALLFRRNSVIASGGWDESLQAGQDRDFFISVALSGADIRYQPGCYSIYRRYGNVTVSTSNRRRWLENHARILVKAEQHLASQAESTRYQKALANSYYTIAHNWRDINAEKYEQFLQKALLLDPNFRPKKSFIYQQLATLFGLRFAEQIGSYKYKLKNFLSHWQL